MQTSGIATGLTALAGSLGVFDDASPEVAAYVGEQRAQVAARAQRFVGVTPRVLEALAGADILAVPVKGAVLGGSAAGGAHGMPVWPDPSTRPMSDIDVLVPPRHRAQAAAVLTHAGWMMHQTNDFEDTFLAWGDGKVGRTDGESVEHNGRIEVHPGWLEFLHGYTARGFDLEAHAAVGADRQARLDDAAFAVHVIGHLASTVVRAEVRAVNVLDVLVLHQRGIDWAAIGAVTATVDARLVGPGLWLVDRVLPGLVPDDVLGRELSRLRGADALAATPTAAVLRDPGPRTTARWRASFTTSAAERAAVVRQLGRSAVRRLR